MQNDDSSDDDVEMDYGFADDMSGSFSVLHLPCPGQLSVVTTCLSYSLHAHLLLAA